MNKVFLTGFLGADPEIKQAGESKVCNARIATSEKRKGRDGTITEITDWHNLVFWGQMAEVMQKYAQKGTHMFIEAKQQGRSYTGSDGIKKHTTENVVTAFEFLGNYKKPHTGGTDFKNDEPIQTAYEVSKNGEPF